MKNLTLVTIFIADI